MKRPNMDPARHPYPVIVGRSYSTPGPEATEQRLRADLRAAVAAYLTVMGETEEVAVRAADLAVADRLARRGSNVITLDRQQLAHYATRATKETTP